MQSDLPSRVPLICLACRKQEGSDWNLHTLEVARVARADGDDILDGALRCVDPACGKEYPILDGIAVVHPDPAALLERELAGLFDPALAPEALALLARDVPDDKPLTRQLEVLSIYLDGHWADHAYPTPNGVPHPAGPELLARVRTSVEHAPVRRAVELGSSVGRWTHILAGGAELTVALDQSLGALRRARRILAGQTLAYARRSIGRYYTTARISAPPVTTPVLFVCGDAHDPPFAPASFDRVVALNLLDIVPNPARVLDVAAALCRPGADLHVASPYAWTTGHVDEGKRVGARDPAIGVANHLRGAGLVVEDEADFPWRLRRDDRATVVYLTHYLRARRPGL